ncbi:hypothetical protein GCK72_022282 [Caenorhabditis remanei]|uniref:Receptor-mediated endocytosis protein 6 n=1 Tax=Caenorhabditis remanei TaxID=31234 RepID=A0A6A5FTK8_CAERE|nr:hypothetical protein GCK72_022282 [Caenorhabditis remanei]KAF1745835.1 hypothetical protein GCK72_022282 [Caenorhabditis remanei]
MSEAIERIRSQDEYRQFYELATKIRNQKLLADAELNSLNRHKQEVADIEIKLLTEAWRSSYWNLKNQSLEPNIACRLLKEINDTEAQPAYKHVGHHFSTLDQLLTVLYKEPSTVAELLNNFDQNDVSSNDAIIQVFFHLVYSCGLYPEDELKIAQVVCYLLKLQLLKSGTHMRTMLRKETSMSTRFYKHFVELMHPTMVYLTKALRKGVLDVIQLGSFWLDIDVKQSTTRFIRDGKQDQNRFPEYRAMVVSKLVYFVDTFLEQIYLALPMLPPNLNWIIREIFCSLYELVDDISAIELSHACKDMIVSNLICPAIISPQKCGVVDNDVRIGNIVNHNLVQIAMIIQMISLREFESPPEEYKEFLSQCRNTHLISEMMDALLIEKLAPDVEITSLIANGSAVSDMQTKSSFVGSVADVNVLTKMIRSTPASTNNNIERIVAICEKLPETLASTIQKSNVENAEESPKVSTLRNIHRKMQQSLKRTGDSFYDAMEVKNEEGGVFGKENFDLFFLDYSSENYVEASEMERRKNEAKERRRREETERLLLDTPTTSEPAPAAPPAATKEDLIDFSASTVTDDPISISPEPAADESKGFETSPESTQATEAGGRLAKLKSLSDRMKKGITQSNTLSDIRGHLRRSGSLIKPGMATSASDQNLPDATNVPRDDILAKYASISSIKQEKPPLTKLISDNKSSARSEVTEPYYSPENLVSCRAFKDTLRKMVTVLGNVSYLPRIGYRNETKDTSVGRKELLNKFLDGVLVETEHRREYGQAAQLREVKRCIELFENAGVEILIEHLKLNEIEQADVVKVMREERATLMRKSNDIVSLEQRVLLNRRLTEQNLVDFLMRTFLETGFHTKHAVAKTPEVAAVLKFYDEFKYLQANDERAEFLKNLLAYLKDRLMQNVDWNYATDTMLDRAMTTIERYVMFAVYDTAFHPNKEAETHRDKLLKNTIAKVANVVTPVNDFLKIPEHLHGEAPWPSAQAELSMLDIYVTAQDKLNCVVRCCDVINNLVALSSKNAVASADDLTPVLVFVIIKANPRALLSNLQFIETFAGDRIESGRDAYYWVNFKSAVEYIKTIL